MKTFLLSVLLLTSSHLLHAQFHPADDYLVDNCQCKSYQVRMPNPKVFIEFMADSLKRIFVSREIMFEDYTNIDSFYYNEQNQISEKRSFQLHKGNIEYLGKTTFAYLPFGKISRITKMDSDNALREKETFNWDVKDRPLLFTNDYYEADTIFEHYELRFKFIHDTLSLLEYHGKKLRSTSKRIYNKKGLLVKEYAEKKSEGAKVTYEYKYTKEDKLHSIQKVKVIGGDIPSFETYPYLYLLDRSRKIEFSYDIKGRLSGYKTYDNIALDKVFSYQIIYQD